MDEELHFGMPGGSGDYEDEDDETDVRDAIPTASQRRRPETELERFDLGPSDVDWCEGEDGDDAYEDEEEQASQADDGSSQNVEDWGHSWFDLGTSDVDRYECEHGEDADAAEEEYASQADDGSTQKVENSGHSPGKCDDWTVYFRPEKTIMAKQMQRQAMYPKRRLYCNMWRNLKAKHKWGERGTRYIAIAERWKVAFGREKAWTLPGIV